MAKEVVIFTGQGCRYCMQTKAFMNGNGVAFTEKNIHEDAEAMTEYEKYDVMGIPLTVVDGEEFVGFTPELQQALLK